MITEHATYWLMLLFIDTATKGFVLLLVAALAVMLLKRASASLRHLVWVSAIVGLLLLPVLSLALPRWEVLPIGPTDLAVTQTVDLPATQMNDEQPVAETPLPVRQVVMPISVTKQPPLVNLPELPKIMASSVPETETPVDMVGSSEPLVVIDTAVEAVAPDARTVTAEQLGLVVLIAWGAGVTLLLARLVLAGLALARLAGNSRLIEDPMVTDLLNSLRARLGIRRPVRIACSERCGMPMTWGVRHARILLPADWESWDRPCLEAVLIHELSHVRRFDALTQLLVQVACAFYWYNPLAWIAAWRIRVEREWACDDMVISRGARPSGYAELLLALATDRELPCLAQLSAVSLLGGVRLEGRVRRVLDGRLNRRTITRGVLAVCLLAVTCVAVPVAMLHGDSDKPTLSEPKDAEKPSVASTWTFELLVVGPDGKAVPEASVEVRTRPVLEAKQILQGELVDAESSRANVRTDRDGRLVLELPKKPRSFNVSIQTPGYGPYWAGTLNSTYSKAIPSKLTAELDAGWSVGGVIVDEAGNPIEGVTVLPHPTYKKRPGDTVKLRAGKRIKTDAHGVWRFDSVPVSARSVSVEINHPNFKPSRPELTRGQYGTELGQTPESRIVLERGLTVTGTVTDESGRPVVDALVRTKFLNDIREARTDKDGVYRLVGCEPVLTNIVVSAESRALDMKELRLGSDMDPVDFQMVPGGRVRVRVLDKQGNPAPKARILVQEWRGEYDRFLFEHVSQEVDEDGVWEWHEAPVDEFVASINKLTGVPLGPHTLIGREEEYVVKEMNTKRKPSLVVSGKVVDATTGEPIKNFRVIPGDHFIREKNIRGWREDLAFTAKDGQYSFEHSQAPLLHFFRIESDGYLTATSADIKGDEGNAVVDIELHRGSDITTILTPGGKPAARAKVALGVAGSQIRVDNGTIDDGSTYAVRQDADTSGRLRLPPQTNPYHLVVTHPSGFAHVEATAESRPTTIQLKAWARVEGTYRIQRRLAGDVPITLGVETMHSYGAAVPSISAHHDEITGPDGRFVFERVVAGDGLIGRRIMLSSNDGARSVTSAQRLGASFPSGETVQIDLGQPGRPVVGTLRPPKDFSGNVVWSFAMVDVESAIQPPVAAEAPGDGQDRRTWWLAWRKTEEGKKWELAYEQYERLRAASPRFRATVDRDGTFRIDDMPAGEYSMSVSVRWSDPDTRDNPRIRLQDYRFTIPAMEKGWLDEPLDLGDLILEEISPVQGFGGRGTVVSPKEDTSTAETKTSRSDEADAARTRTFELLVVGPDGKPVPEASVEIRRPFPKPEQITRGEFVEQGPYGAFMKADESGRLGVELPKKQNSLNISIKTPGYGPYSGEWSSIGSRAIPATFTAELDAAWSVGGVIVDSEGAPVEEAEVRPSIYFKKRPGDKSRTGIGTRIKTDADGRWRFDSVQDSKDKVFVEINHPDFSANRRYLTRVEFGLDSGQDPATQIVLNRGLTVTGTVTDQAGSPITDALVRTKFLNDIREATTDEEGHYKLVGCEAKMARVVVSAKGRATDMKEVQVDPDMDSVDFQMVPGGKVRIRVLDEDDNPVPKARILFQGWRGRWERFEFDHKNQYADENGVWEWDEAPLDEFKADICPPGGMDLSSQPLIARDEEYVFRPPSALIISGKVVDAATGETIKSFRVIPGVRFRSSDLGWLHNESFTATNGQYRLRHGNERLAFLVRIEADGYRPVESRDIKANEGQVTIDFELEDAQDASPLLLTPDGSPAVGANIAIGVAGAQIYVRNGEIDDVSTYSARQTTDKSGRFRFPPPEEPCQLVITHPEGFARVQVTPDSIPTTIQLEAWARVEGVFRIGGQLVGDVSIDLQPDGLSSSGSEELRLFSDYSTRTDQDGRFVFERVPTGRGRISREIVYMMNQGARSVASSCRVPLDFVAGETLHVELGGTGRPVIGKLSLREGSKEKALWNFARIEVAPDLERPTSPDVPDMPDDVRDDADKQRQWWLDWQESEAGKVWTDAQREYLERIANSPSFFASVDRDGSFRIDDMPEGRYMLSVHFGEHSVGYLQDHRFTVPPMEGGRSDEPLDLGVLTLEGK